MEFAKKLIESNPLFNAGIGLGVLGFGAAIFRKGMSQTYKILQKKYIISMEIPSKDPSFPWVLDFLSKNELKNKMLKKNKSNFLFKLKPLPPNKLSVNTDFIKRENGSTSHSFNLNPGIGSYFSQYNGKYFFVERTREAKMIDLKNGSPWETLTLTTLSMDKDIFLNILEDAKKEASLNETGKLVLYTSWGVDWKQFGLPKRKRNFDSVVLDNNIAENLLMDVKNFLKNGSWYFKRGIPYRRGYLLHGPPGSGKTSFIQALAGELDYNICLLNLSERGMTDDKLAHLLNQVPPRSFVLLEDIDAAFPARSEATENTTPKSMHPPLLTLSGLLNALDGVQSSEERIIFMTTNHLSKLDAALIRPGRVDVKQLIDNVTDYQIKKLFLKFFENEEEKSKIFLSKIKEIMLKCNKTLSAAQLQGHFVLFKDNVDEVIENVDKLFD
ncbi:hypothetical protein HK099_008572 [Clydaea vesicula]|uniref:Mitochondrial chaperone BCS1 n=1 Tax=Clydaea vesicula TaxID=447962 RepID=A0AAD5TYK5_9FUNG|nr:hypothetical protein HK099_008572 [Clydaea vesicula]KAJ3397376.1 hypothetical protein HDU92_008367 [Lobulomyces angularis]